MILPGLRALSNHMVLFLRVFGSRPLSAQLPFGDTKEQVLKAGGESRERAEVCVSQSVLLDPTGLQNCDSALCELIVFWSLSFFTCKAGL